MGKRTQPQKSSCSICVNLHYAKGYCQPHYYRLGKHGDPLGGRTPRGGLMRWINDVALHHTGDECLMWPFGKNSSGYGSIRVSGKMVIASRYVCKLAHGEPPTTEHEAAHSCGKGDEGCIAPRHMSWKTPVENSADKLVHGTHNRGDRNGRSKLLEADVRVILSMRGVKSQGNLAARFGVTKSTISNIHTGRKWAWLSEGVSA